jgi:hypothetical protein
MISGTSQRALSFCTGILQRLTRVFRILELYATLPLDELECRILLRRLKLPEPPWLVAISIWES